MSLRRFHLTTLFVAVCTLCAQAALADEPAAVTDGIVIDDFESYTDEYGQRMYETWIDGVTNGTGSIVGNLFEEEPPVHSGRQSLPFDYNNVSPPYYSEAYRTWEVPQNWTVNGVADLSLWLHGQPIPFLVKAQDSLALGIGWKKGEWVGVELRFGYRQLSGDGEIVARIDTLKGHEEVARAGVMVQETLKYDSKFAAVAVGANGGIIFEHRLLKDWTKWADNQHDIRAPHWVKLSRRGNTFTAQHSADGQQWQDVADAQGTPVAVDIPMAETVCIGAYMLGNAWAAPTTGELSGIAFTGDVSGPWQVAEGAWGNAPDDLYVVLEDSAGKTGVVVNPDPGVLNVIEWTEWKIPLSVFSRVGVNLKSIKTMYLGVGDRNRPQPDGRGRIFVDDVRLLRRLCAADPYPADGEVNVPQSLTLRWSPGSTATHHDIYFGTDPNAVASATPATTSIYRGRQTKDETTFGPGVLGWNKTYYWRIDEVNDVHPDSPWKGNIWHFTTADFLIIDDFESYTEEEGYRIWETWIDAWSSVSDGWLLDSSTSLERQILHTGRQSMAFDYNNIFSPYYSEADLWFATAQDWTINGADTLVLFIRGLSANDAASMYASIEDSTHKADMVVHPSPQLTATTKWTEWRIPLGRLTNINPAKVRQFRIGVGNPEDRHPGGTGRIYIDDIRVIKSGP